MDNNNEIINNIREIYRTSPSNKIHQLIAKHFIPSVEERKNNKLQLNYSILGSESNIIVRSRLILSLLLYISIFTLCSLYDLKLG